MDLSLVTAIEVASVKAQAQHLTSRLRAALHDIYGDVEELEEIIDHLPEEGSEHGGSSASEPGGSPG